MRASSRRTPYCTARNHLPERLGGAPWVRCPPAASDMPRMVSPGCSSASITAWFACEPECGCTLAKAQSNSRLARSIASCSATSTILAAAVIAPARIALGIFVGEHRALRLEHGARDDVLRRDQLDLVLLALQLAGRSRAASSGSALGERRRRRSCSGGRRGGAGVDMGCSLAIRTVWRRGGRGARPRRRS